MTQTMTGGCQCGKVRYEVPIDGDDAYLCHCRMCQRATGGFAAAFVEVPAGTVRWLSEPDWYASSAIAQRPFCAACGTPLGFAWRDGTGGQDLTLGSFDDPSRFKPTAHFGTESLHAAWIDLLALPRHATGTVGSVAQRWEAAGLEVPE
jgi:hypothetical protein